MTTSIQQSILLFSGGIDSYIAWHYLNYPPTLYFNLRSRYSDKEIKVVRELIPETAIDNSLDLGDREIGEKAYIPFRNLLLAAQAALYADIIIIAGVADDVVSDKNKEIFCEFSSILSKLENRQIMVYSPFWYLTKEEIVRWYMNRWPWSQLLLKTTSCYHPTEHYCGACPSCFRKWVALRSNGVELGFHNDDLMDEYYQSALNNKYIPKRNQAIIREIDAYRS